MNAKTPEGQINLESTHKLKTSIVSEEENGHISKKELLYPSVPFELETAYSVTKRKKSFVIKRKINSHLGHHVSSDLIINCNYQSLYAYRFSFWYPINLYCKTAPNPSKIKICPAIQSNPMF